MAEKNDDLYFVTYNDKDGAKAKQVALNEHAKGLQSAQAVIHENRGVHKIRSTASTIYQNIGPGRTSVRDGFNRRDYEELRRDEYLPEDDKEIIQAAMDAYKNIGIVHNTIDLMTDLVVQGIDIEHPVKSQRRFFKRWFHEKVNGPDRTERIASIVYRGGTAIVKRQTATITRKDAKQMQQVSGETPTLKKREIPWKYTILNPLSVDVKHDYLADLIDADARQYGLVLNKYIMEMIKTQSLNDRETLKKVPSDLLNTLRQTMRAGKGGAFIPLKRDEISIVSYKKDDWELWAKPICHSILDDLHLYQKMKMADLSALDGAIAQIRLWKLGDLEHQIFPKEAAFQRLAQILVNAVSGGVADIMWGPAIDLIETSTDLHYFLGETKYVPVLKAILAGLGLPSALSGYGDQGMTNNMVEIKVLIQRLKYMRQLLINFWNKEIRLVQKAMGFDRPATLVFDVSLMDDEATMQTILLSAYDRKLISKEVVQERLGTIPEVENVRINREWRDEEKGKIPPQAGPFHNPQVDDAFKKEVYKSLIDSGRIDPTKVLEELFDEDLDGIDISDPPAPEAPGGSGKPPVKKKSGNPNGRPPGSKDKTQRKQKVVKPISGERVQFVKNLLWAEQIQKEISDIVTPIYLGMKSKQNARQLCDTEFRELEKIKFAVLCNLPTGAEFSKEKFSEMVKSGVEPSKDANLLLHNCIISYVQTHGEEPPTEKIRNLQSKVVAILNYEEADNSGSAAS